MDEPDLDEVRVLGRRWAREVATAEELASALDATEDEGAVVVATSAQAFLAVNGIAPDAGGSLPHDVVGAFLEGVATSEGEE